jgi:RNA polymerase sigma factor (sigma-70 family)
LRLGSTVKVKDPQAATPQEQLARDAAEFRRGLRARFATTLSAEDVEDIVQTALITKAPTSDDGRNPRQRRAWFARVVHHAAIDYLRARDGRNRAGRGPRQLSLDLIDEIFDGEAETAVAALRVEDDGFDADRLDRDYDIDAIRALARRALGRLSRDDRRLIGLRYRDGLTNAQLADEFGLTVKGLEKRWARAWVAFVSAASGEVVAEPTCSALRDAVVRREFAGPNADAAARWEAHLQSCPACRVWQHVGSQAAAAMPTLPIDGGLAGGLVGKLGLGALLERLHVAGEHVATATGIGGGGAGAGVLSALGGKAAATCITAVVCAGGAAFVAAPVVQRAVDPPKKEHRDNVASKPHAKAAGASGAQRPTTTVSSAPAAVAPAPQVARKATRTQASVQTPAAKRKTRESARIVREKAQAKKARATSSPFTPEANDPTPAAVAASTPATSSSTATAAAPAPTPPPAPADSSHFSGEFSP